MANEVGPVEDYSQVLDTPSQLEADVIVYRLARKIRTLEVLMLMGGVNPGDRDNLPRVQAMRNTLIEVWQDATQERWPLRAA